MIPINLVQVKTADGIILDGAYIKSRRKSKHALIWLPGLSSRFSSGQILIKELSSRLAKGGIGYFKFDTRGHDIVARGVKGSRTKALIGSGFERFQDCILDIRAMIAFVKKEGYRDIILAGHSTGANKALYYLYRTGDKRIKGLALLGPISDVVVGLKNFGRRRLNQALKIAEKLKFRNPGPFMPREYGIYTAERFLSLHRSGSQEDVFHYHDPKAYWKELLSVRVPVAVILGSRDEYLDRTPKEFLGIFQKNAAGAKSFTGISIKGAPHGFQRKERELALIISKWIKGCMGK